MMKSFIIAATSIAYIFSISNIADAKVAKVKAIGINSSCLNQTSKDESLKYLSVEDIKGICTALNDKYKKFNDLAIGRLSRDVHIRLIETIKLELVNPESYDKDKKRIVIMATQIERNYRRAPSQKLGDNDLAFISQVTVKTNVEVRKEGDRWTVPDIFLHSDY